LRSGVLSIDKAVMMASSFWLISLIWSSMAGVVPILHPTTRRAMGGAGKNWFRDHGIVFLGCQEFLLRFKTHQKKYNQEYFFHGFSLSKK